MPPASEDLSLEKISFDNEVFTGVINSCAAKAASENVDAFLGYTTAAAVGAVSGAAMASAAAAIAGPVALLQNLQVLNQTLMIKDMRQFVDVCLFAENL